MAGNQELEEQFSNCKSLIDVLELSQELLSSSKDPLLTEKLLNQAHTYCVKPTDYLQLGDFATSVKNSVFANQMYLQAEQTVCEASEFIAAADRMILANKKEKAELFLNKAADHSLNSMDLFQIADTAKKSLGNKELAKNLLFGHQDKIKDLEGYVNLCKSLIHEGDKSLAKNLFLLASRYSHDAIGKISYATAIQDLFSDNNWVKKVLVEAESMCVHTKDFVALAKAYISLLDDDSKTSFFMEKAEESCELNEEHIDLAEGFWKLLHNKEKAVISFEKAVAVTTDKEVLLSLAKNVSFLENIDLAKTIYAKAEQYMSSTSELCRLAQSVVNDLNDKDYAAEIYQRASENSSSPTDLINLANDVIFNLNDKQQARSIYEKAYNTSNNYKQLLTLLDFVEVNVEDKDFASNILKKAEECAENTADLLEVSTQILSVLDYKDFAREVTESAEDRATSVSEMKSLVAHVGESFSEDEDWTDRLNEKLAKYQANQSK